MLIFYENISINYFFLEHFIQKYIYQYKVIHLLSELELCEQ